MPKVNVQFPKNTFVVTNMEQGSSSSDTGAAPAKVAGKEISIFIYGDIGFWWGINKTEILSQLRGKSATQINLYISSNGGEVADALPIYDLLAGHKANVTAYLSGIVASAATFIACAANEVVMSKQTVYMIHRAQSEAYGDADELRKRATTAETFDSIIADIYVRKTKMKKADVLNLMKQEIWMEHKEAKKLGFVDRVEDTVAIDFELTDEYRYEDDSCYGYYNKADALETKRAFVNRIMNKGYLPINAKDCNKFSNKKSIIMPFGKKLLKKISNLLVNKGTIEESQVEEVENAIAEDETLLEELQTEATEAATKKTFMELWNAKQEEVAEEKKTAEEAAAKAAKETPPAADSTFTPEQLMEQLETMEPEQLEKLRETLGIATSHTDADDKQTAEDAKKLQELEKKQADLTLEIANMKKTGSKEKPKSNGGSSFKNKGGDKEEKTVSGYQLQMYVKALQTNQITPAQFTEYTGLDAAKHKAR